MAEGCIDNQRAAELYANWCLWQSTIRDPTPNRNYYPHQPFYSPQRIGFESVLTAPDIPVAEATEKALLRMPEHLSAALMMKLCHGLTDHESALRLGVNERTVRKHTTAALTWLAESWCKIAAEQFV